MGLSDNQRAGDMKTAASNYDRFAAAAWRGCSGLAATSTAYTEASMAVNLLSAVMFQWTMTGCRPCQTTSAS